MPGARQEPEVGAEESLRNFVQGAVSFPMQLSLFRGGCGDYKSTIQFSFLSTFLSIKCLANDLNASISTDREMTHSTRAFMRL